MNRAFVNILSADVEATARFYQDLLGMKRIGDFGWFIILSHVEMPAYEIGILDRDHETIPIDMPSTPGGYIMTFVVDDVEKAHVQAIAMRAEIIEEPTELAYGQRRLLLRDPAGSIVDVSAPTQ
ncbi:MAG: VOC family protein [Pseudomonadota bacterium]